MSEKIQKASSHQKSQQNKKVTKKTSDKEEEDENKTNSNLNIFAANADGLQGKELSLKNEVIESKASIFCVQETKFRKSGRFAMNNFVVF